VDKYLDVYEYMDVDVDEYMDEYEYVDVGEYMDVNVHVDEYVDMDVDVYMDEYEYVEWTSTCSAVRGDPWVPSQWMYSMAWCVTGGHQRRLSMLDFSLFILIPLTE